MTSCMPKRVTIEYVVSPFLKASSFKLQASGLRSGVNTGCWACWQARFPKLPSYNASALSGRFQPCRPEGLMSPPGTSPIGPVNPFHSLTAAYIYRTTGLSLQVEHHVEPGSLFYRCEPQNSRVVRDLV